MIGLDTNVLLRYFVKDDLAQWEKATHFIAARCSSENPGFIDRVALCEMLWVLSRGHGYSRPDIVRVIQQLLATQELLLEDEELVRSALQSYESSRIDFPDALIARVNLARGCEGTATFDRKAARYDGFIRVP
ncbi:MAG: type II toxin-antitoxin system VapC family toxin [Xanthobacteraceae bacterium]|jgi:predicted nucleic-acid-binding protein